eukprot:5214320-Pyramimonas_sp.AAC.1
MVSSSFTANKAHGSQQVQTILLVLLESVMLLAAVQLESVVLLTMALLEPVMMFTVVLLEPVVCFVDQGKADGVRRVVRDGVA